MHLIDQNLMISPCLNQSRTKGKGITIIELEVVLFILRSWRRVQLPRALGDVFLKMKVLLIN